MKFDVEKYRTENDGIKLSTAQKNAIKTEALSQSASRSVFFPVWARTAAAALALLMLGGGIWLNFRSKPNSGNMFSVTANAASAAAEGVELGNEFKPVGELKHYGGGASHVFDDDDNLTEAYIYRFMDFSYNCTGNNIRSITFKANNGAFRIADSDGITDLHESDYLYTKESLKKIKKGAVDFWTGDIVSSYTVNPDYINKENADEPNICLISKIDLMSKDCPKELKDGYNSDFETQEQLKKYTQLEADTALKDLSVDVSVTYSDGSTETKTMLFSADVEIFDWETEPVGKYSYDSKTILTAKIK